MAYNSNITPGAPPLLWSDVQEAFRQVNENFDILVATVGDGSGLTPLNFETLDTNVSPTVDNEYKLGDITHKWRAVHTGQYTLEDSDNGVWLGNAQIKGLGFTVNLPASSTIGGDPLTGIGTSLIIDPDKTFFKEIQVNNDLSVVATTFGDTVNFLAGSGVGLAVSSGADSITFSNTGVLSIANGVGISSATVSGVATITNAGVRSLQSVAALPGGRSTGAGINITGSVGDNLRITNTGVLSISQGVGITVSLDSASGEVSITNSAPAGNTFAVIQVNGDVANRLIADGGADTFNVNSGQGITLTKDTATDTMTITVDPVFDLKGSVFGDDSSILVDAVSNFIFGNVSATTLRTSETKLALGLTAGATAQGAQAVAVGNQAGQITQGNTAVAIGSEAGRSLQGAQGIAIGYQTASVGQGGGAIAIGQNAGLTNQGGHAIAIGTNAGTINQTAGSIVLNATSIAVNTAAAAFYVAPVRNQTGTGGVVQYDAATKEVSYSTALGSVSGTFSGNIFTNLIDSADSSAITVTPVTIFSTDVVVENDLSVAERLTLKGSRVINLAELKTVVAASVSFADFQTQIAALV